jgi:hypothetical protein
MKVKYLNPILHLGKNTSKETVLHFTFTLRVNTVASLHKNSSF